NRCAAGFLAGHNAKGPFVRHSGFRGDRLDEAHKFLAMHAPEVAELDLAGKSGYRTIMRALGASASQLPLRSMVNRLLARAELTQEPGLHMGMGLDCYTNCTSPLRKYVDFLVHLQIKAILAGGDGSQTAADDSTLERLREHLLNARSATGEAERWLASRYLQRLEQEEPGRSYSGVVAHINSSGFSVRLTDNGLEGLVDLRKDPEKFSYDKWTASLTSTTRRFQLEQPVTVLLAGTEADSQHLSLFTLAQGCGLKPLKLAK
ncbi:MAG: RNB domain-containing ribonuclease, partial [Parahaliea sp.]